MDSGPDIDVLCHHHHHHHHHLHHHHLHWSLDPHVVCGVYGHISLARYLLVFRLRLLQNFLPSLLHLLHHLVDRLVLEEEVLVEVVDDRQILVDRCQLSPPPWL